MRIFYYHSLLLVAILFFLCMCLNNNNYQQNLEIWASYNVQNLFDDQLDGTEYKDFKKSASSHFQKKLITRYDTDLKILQISHVLSEIKKEYGRFGVLILQEVENLNILNILKKNTPSLWPLNIIFTKQKDQAVGIAILTHHPIKNIEKLDGSLFYKNSRPILSVTITVGNQEVVIIAVHLPSYRKKIHTEIRLNTLRYLSSEVTKILEKGQAIFLGGDFNEDLATISEEIFKQFDPKNPLIKEPSLLRNGYDFLNHENLQKTIYPENIQNGTYFYRSEWKKIDHLFFSSHFFINPKVLNLINTVIYRPNFLLQNTSYGPIPKKFKKGMRKESAGYSDHLPLLALINTG